MSVQTKHFQKSLTPSSHIVLHENIMICPVSRTSPKDDLWQTQRQGAGRHLEQKINHEDFGTDRAQTSRQR